MIYFLVDRDGAFGIENFKLFKAGELAERIEVLLYEELPERRSLPVGTYVFSALDQLTPSQVQMAADAWEALEATGEDILLLNHPMRARRRYDLLGSLYEAGLNRFGVWRASRPDEADRFPVFVRSEREHIGSLTPLLTDAEMLRRALRGLGLRGWHRRELIVVEFCDTVTRDGLFAKYSAFRMAGRILPRYLTFGAEFIVKHGSSRFDRDAVEAELAYHQENPHADHLAEVCQLAKIDYGRLDYGVLDGAPQIWEINLNPTIGRGLVPRQRPPGFEEVKPIRERSKEIFYGRFREAWTAIDRDPRSIEEIPWDVPAEMRRRIDTEVEEQRRRKARRELRERLSGNPVSRWLRRHLRAS